jgi:hypothetical protein
MSGYKTASETFKKGVDLRLKNYGYTPINLDEFKQMREQELLKRKIEKPYDNTATFVENYDQKAPPNRPPFGRSQEAQSVNRPPKVGSQKPSPDLTLKWSTHTYTSPSNPNVWGPCAWLYFHISSANYPMKASNITKELMKNRLLALPIEIPCSACRPHAQDFIELNRSRLDEICSGRDNLFKFFVDFHNKVNERHNKPQMSYEEAYSKYVNGENIQVMKMV